MLTTTGTTRKELLSLHRKAVTAISKMKLSNLTIDIEHRIRPELSDAACAIVVFSKSFNNHTFTFYSHTSHERNKENLECVISKIKLDDFDEIKSLAY